MTSRRIIYLCLTFIAGACLPSISGCKEPNPDHCYNSGGDSYCASKHGDAKPYCSDNSCVEEPSTDGCMVEEPTGCWYCNGNEEPECSPSVGDGDGDGDGDADLPGDGDGDGDGDPGPSCTASSECPVPETPLCDAGECVACGEAVAATCADEHPETPVCDETGMCVQCNDVDISACPTEMPACSDNVCVPCTEHRQCPASACNMATGECMPIDPVYYVDNGVDGPGSGSQQDPFRTIALAMSALNGGDGTIYVDPGVTSYNTPTVISPGQSVAILGDGNVRLQVNGTGLLVELGGHAFVEGLRIYDGTTGVYVSGGSVWLDRTWVVDSKGSAALYVSAGRAVVRNCFIGGNSTAGPGIMVAGQGQVESLYTSVVIGAGADMPAIRCLGVTGFGSTIRNSLVVSRLASPEIEGCSELSIQDSALEMMVPDNTALGMMTTNAWFTALLSGDFHLADAHPPAIDTAARWQLGDPSTDIDGDPRPSMAGSPDVAGADIP